MSEQILVQMDKQGRIVLPRSLREKKRTYFACQTEKDGTVHLTPVVGLITSKQAYFWTKRWQRGEKEASRALKKGKYKTVESKALEKYLSSF